MFRINLFFCLFFSVCLLDAKNVQLSDDSSSDSADVINVNIQKSGSIVKETYNEVLDFKELVLSNGIKVILKKTDLNSDEIIFSAQCTGGRSLYGKRDWANLKLFNTAVAWSGLGEYSSSALGSILRNKNVNMDLTMTDTHSLVEGSSTPEELETMFKLAYLYFTNIRKDTTSFNTLTYSLTDGMGDQDNQPDKIFSDSVVNTIYGHDSRLRSLEKKDFDKADVNRIMQIAKEITSNPAAYTFTIVGNFDDKEIRSLICRYIATLSEKKSAKLGHRIGAPAKGIIVNKFHCNANVDKANALIYWHNDNMKWSLENKVKAEVAGKILYTIYSNILPKVEKSSYKLGAYGKMIHYEDGLTSTIIAAQCPMTVQSKDSSVMILRNAAYLLSKKCDQTLLSHAQLGLLMTEEENLRTNNYWFDILSYYDKYGIDLLHDYNKTVSSLTLQDICEFMKQFLKSGNRIEVVMIP
nr:hypothetical protein [Prevotella sp.]